MSRNIIAPSVLFSLATHLTVLVALAGFAAPLHAQTNTINLPNHFYTPGDTVEWVKRLPHYCEGPAWNPTTQEITFSQIGSPGTGGATPNRPDWLIWRIKPGVDTGSVFYDKGQSNGQVMDPWDRLTVIQRDMVIRFDSTGAVDTLVRSGDNGVTFNANNNTDGGAGNDLSFASNGAFYFTNLATGIFYVDTAGTLTQAFSGAQSANGIHWIEEEDKVYVHEGNTVRRYDRGANGALSNRTIMVQQQGMGADGGCIDVAGNRWVADYSQGMIRVYSSTWESLGNITMRSATGIYNARSGNAGNASNCTFGGEDLRTLYITGDGGLYSLRVTIPGRVLPSPAVSLRAPARAPVQKVPEGGRLRDLLGRALPETGRTAPMKSLPAAPLP